MKVVVKRVGEEPELREMTFNMDMFRAMVDGWVEVVNFVDYTVFCDEDAKLKRSAFNCVVRGIPLYGHIVAVGPYDAKQDCFLDVDVEVLDEVLKC